MSTETLLAISIFLIYWFLTLFTYMQEKIDYASRVGPAVDADTTLLQWLMGKLHLPREKYLKDNHDENH